MAIEAPVDRLQSAIQVAFFEQLAERANLVGLVAVVHRRVRMIPVAEDAEPLEVLLLPLDLLGRIRAAQPLRLGRRQVLAVRLLDLHFDRHAVAIPAGHVRDIEAGERAALDDRVLQDLVDGVTDVDVAVRVRRTVVQDEARPAARRDANRVVHAIAPPRVDPAGFPAREIAAHRKRRVRQVQRRLVVGAGVVGHAVSWFRRRTSVGPAAVQRSRGEIFARFDDVAPDLAASARRGRETAPRHAACAGTPP